MDLPSEYRAGTDDANNSGTKSSQKRRSKGNKNQKAAQPQAPQQQQYFQDFGMQNPQPYMQNPGQPDMFYGGQGFDQGAYGGQMAGMPQFPGQQLLNDPMANMAMQYGQQLAGQGKDIVNKNVEKYISSSKLKYYFAVDTAYVGKKLGLLLFPFTHSDWSIRYNQEEPIAPRYEINAPDLYIPVMAFVTYVLVAGMVLGIQDRFTPEQLGVQASSALVWLIIELVAMSLSLYIMNLNTELKYLDIVAYCGYKFVGMTFSLLAGAAFGSTAYYCVLLWFCLSLVFFLMRTLKVQVLPHQDDDGFTRGGKRSLYLILSVSLVQPLLMWWLTSYIMVFRKV
ncbi:protein YIF1B-B [Aplysia californica]|uniref:Protein YIF1 n=1 Tax=Aplysia californica TaxID=6500 RepID=A0ABM0JM96_APLCA|nr:protein YIF1B-B [Aplysia californica]